VATWERDTTHKSNPTRSIRLQQRLHGGVAIEPKHQCLPISPTPQPQMGLGLAHRALTTFATSHDDEHSNRKASSFLSITTQTNSTLHSVLQHIRQTIDPYPPPPRWGKGGDPSTHNKVYADHEKAIILSNAIA
jgi:hypothetical protein